MIVTSASRDRAERHGWRLHCECYVGWIMVLRGEYSAARPIICYLDGTTGLL